MTSEARTHVDVGAAYHAIQTGAMLADRSDRTRILFTGEKAAESLTGLVTSDVMALRPGTGQPAVALTVKGKILADIRIFAREDGLLVDVSPTAAPNWIGIVRKYVNPRLAKYRDISAETVDIGIFGSGASEIVRSAFPDAELAPGLPAYSHVVASAGGSALMIIRTSEYGVDGYDVIGPREAITDIRSILLAAGASDENPDALRIARVEAGRPVWGVDMDDSMLAQEMDMERFDAISFTKGCYTGQETVARVHFRGHVNRMLRGLRFAEATLPPSGSTIAMLDGKEVGVVKSGAISPRMGAIALAIVRLEVEPGTPVTVTWPGGHAEARVETLPFANAGR